MPRAPAAHGAPGGTLRPSRALYARIGPEVDAAVRAVARTEARPLGRVVECAIAAYLAEVAPPCGCTPATAVQVRK
jgi:hypothetical protein